MPSAIEPSCAGGVAFRCDGGEQIGAGHVARCLPLAAAFVQLGWKVAFVGAYDGLARWLLDRAGMVVRAPDPDAPCGVDAGEHEAAVVDSYLIAPAAICELAKAMPVVTLAEANRCPTAGILVDYHLDRPQRADRDLLSGPSFAPLDPAFAGAGRAGEGVRRVLVTLGGSRAASELLEEISSFASLAFPDAEIVLAGSSRPPGVPRAVALPPPSALVDVVPTIDVAVTAAGLTAYELACAGVPQLAVAIAANQRRVVSGLRTRGLALCLDLTEGDSLADLRQALERLQDAERRRLLAERGMSVFDGRGAQRAASALVRRFALRAQT